ncbi:MAG: hypothetical protein WA821_01670 [Anaerolineales bacterium]
MAILEHLTFSELEKLIRALALSPDTRLTVTFDEQEATQKALKRQKALDAMTRLKGSGNGRLMAALMKSRQQGE